MKHFNRPQAGPSPVHFWAAILGFTLFCAGIAVFFVPQHAVVIFALFLAIPLMTGALARLALSR